MTSTHTYDNFIIKLMVLHDQLILTANGVGETSATAILSLADMLHGVEEAVARIEQGLLNDQDLAEFGENLFTLLFQPKIREIYRTSLHHSKRLQLILNIDPNQTNLTKVPWEYMYEPGRGQLVLRGTPIVRYMPSDLPLLDQTVSLPIKVLLTAAHTNRPSDLNKEIAKIEQALSSLGENVKVVTEPHLTLERLLTHLPQKYHIWHFVGHGAHSQEINSLCFEDGQVAADELSRYLADSGIHTILLNACESGKPTNQALYSLAPALIEANISNVIGMQFAVDTETTFAFSSAFYESLTLGWPIEACVAEGRKKVLASVGLRQHDWGIPIIYTRKPGAQLWPDLRDHVERKDVLLQDFMLWFQKYSFIPISQVNLSKLIELVIRCQNPNTLASLPALRQKLSEGADGFEDFFEMLRSIEQESQEMQQIDLLLEEILCHPVSRKKIAELYTILRDISIDVNSKILQGFYMHCAPKGAIPNSSSTKELLKQMIRILAREGISKEKTHPLLHFIELITPLLADKPLSKSKLQDWLKGTAIALGCLINTQKLEITDIMKKVSEAYIFIFIEPVYPLRPEPFTIRALLLADGAQRDNSSSYEPVIFNATKPEYTCGDLPGVIPEIIAIALNRLDLNPMVEVFLPADILLYPFDQIQIQIDESWEPELIGVQYPLVVRPLDLFAPKGHLKASSNKSERYWKERKEGAHRPGWYTAQNDNPMLLAKLHNEDYTSLISILMTEDTKIRDKLCRTVIQAGVPIALFHRKYSENTIDIEQILKPLSGKENIGILPTKVFELRNVANGTIGAHPGRNLTLLWNNPNRRPRVSALLPLPASTLIGE